MEHLRELSLKGVFALIVGAISLVVGLTTGNTGLALVILVVLAALLLAFWYLTQNRIPVDLLNGLEVEWQPRGFKSQKVKVIRVENGEPEYAIVELDGKPKTALVTELSLTLADRLKYSWRRR
jgi:hypothetical protein